MEILIDNFYTIYFCLYGILVLLVVLFKQSDSNYSIVYSKNSKESTKLNDINYNMNAENCKLEAEIKRLSYEKSRISSIKYKLDNF